MSGLGRGVGEAKQEQEKKQAKGPRRRDHGVQHILRGEFVEEVW
jgi:hypothetical protein